MSSFELHTPADLPAIPGFSQVATISPGSRLVWTAGQVAMTAEGAPPAAGDWEAQTRLVMQNLTIALAAGGAGWSDVFELTIYVVEPADLTTVRAVRDEFVNLERPPTSTLVRVAGLFDPAFLVEIEAVAAVLASR